MPSEFGNETAIPLVEERLAVDVRSRIVDRAVLRKRVELHDETVELELTSQESVIERVQVGQEIDAVPPMREEGDTLVVPVVEERLVKRLVLVEEIRIRRIETTRPVSQTVQLRREVAEIARPPLRNRPEVETEDMAMNADLSPGTQSGSERNIVAMYETYEQARNARDELLAAGIPNSDMDLLDRNAAPGDASFTYEHTDEGIWGAIKRLFMPDEDVHGYAEGVGRGHAMLVVRPGAKHDEVVRILEDTSPVDFDAREQEWRGSGWSGQHAGYSQTAGTAGAGGLTASAVPPVPVTMGAPNAGATGTSGTGATASAPGSASTVPGAATGTGYAAGQRAGNEEVIPIVEEELRVGKREVGRGTVRVRSYVVERPVEEQVRLRREQVEVQRRPVDRAVGEMPADAFRERTIEVTATEEEAVISKEARVVEEVAIRKDVSEHTEQVHETVRRTEVDVDDTRTNQGAVPVNPNKKV